MKKSKLWSILIAALVLVTSMVLLAGNILASGKPMDVTFKSLGEVSDFALTDHLGTFHQFSYYDDKQAMVLFVQGNGCPIVRNSISIILVFFT